MSQVQTADFRVNADLSNKTDTTYSCQMFQLPASLFQTKQHLLNIKAIFLI